VINLRDHPKQLVTHDPTLEDHAAISVYAVELEDIFGDVDAEDVDRHGYSPFIAGSQLARKEGEPSIPLDGGATMAG
jgi:hypothetical protein